MGVIRFDEDGQAKRPIFLFDELVINVPFPHAADDEETIAPSGEFSGWNESDVDPRDER